ncbi:cell adhesion protein byn-1 [Fistulina hepatica ATCC 64428]|uniref:Cell adhesion protein byn-1 n=1 Tax=Fistulina hepatica ATCC 64428 TaxID=1128425 RepID=A0A0D7A5K2_9AGAR|nr:cell adhesion protein byn-1 [Fistulina hepatica ATCC 64428]
MPREPKASGKHRHDPLLVQLNEDEVHAKYGRVSTPGKRTKSRLRQQQADEEETEVIIDSKTSKRIFELARDQQHELEVPEDDDDDAENDADTARRAALSRPRAQAPFDEDDEDEDSFDDAEDVGDAEKIFDIDAGDLQTLDTLLPANAGERQTLADLIFAKLDGGQPTGPAVIQNVKQNKDYPDPTLGLDPRVVETYTKLGSFLRSYKSGPLPKVFKVIPTLPAWARILAITLPENWSPHACRAATRIFISNMKPPQAQLFLNVVLLGAVRADISAHKKLNPQYYEALKRALFKPSAFFKGVIFPLLDDGCTLREAAIVASVLARAKVPVLHASAALLRIAEMDYAGANSLFIRVIVDKKYQLPYKVVDALVFHFIRISNTYKARTRGDAEKLPVLWHQSLLVFVQRYASDLTQDQKDALLDVVRATPHAQISPEVRRELVNSVERGAPRGDEDVEML